MLISDLKKCNLIFVLELNKMQVLYYTTCFFKSFKEKNKVLIVTAEMVSSPVSFCPSAMVPTL